jgi:lipoyl(octanoyl) transferase
VSTHGFAINVLNDLTPFTWIVPCGLAGVSMTSVAKEIGERATNFERVCERVAASLAMLRGQRARTVDPDAIGLHTAAAAAA